MNSNFNLLEFNEAAKADITSECFDNFVLPVYENRPDGMSADEWLRDFLEHRGLYACAKWESGFYKRRAELLAEEVEELRLKATAARNDADYFRSVALYHKERSAQTIEK